MSEILHKSDKQEDAEAEVESFREDLGPFVVAAETSRMAMVFTDAKEVDNPIIFANDSFLKLTGYDREEVLGQSFNFLMADGSDADAVSRIKAEFEAESEGIEEVCYRRKNGSKFLTDIFISPVRDESGNLVQHFASFVDVTKRMDALAESRMLIDELNHRVKNTLATVQSIVAQALRKPSEPAEIRESIESRIFALSRSHDILSRENWKGAGLHDLIEATLEPFGVANGARAERFKVTGANVRLSPKATLALGIAFNELATNAVKYGAFSNDAGCVQVGWTVEAAPKGRLVIEWREEHGPPVTPPSRKGFGSQVIERGLAHELEGEVRLDYLPDGVVSTIAIPVPRGVRNG